MAIRSLKNNTFSRSLLVGNAFYDPGMFVSIATLSGNGSATELTFNNINALSTDYKALQIRAVWNYNAAGPATVQCYMSFNGDNALNYYTHNITSYGASISGTADNGNTGTSVTGVFLGGVHSNEGPMGAAVIDIVGFNDTTLKTTVKAINGANLAAASSDSTVAITSGMWNSTANVSSISFRMTSSRVWGANTRIALYGIKG